MSDLKKMELRGNDFQTAPKKKVDVDFVEDLNYKYLQDLKLRKVQTEFGRATPCVTLRKAVKLGEIDDLVNDCQVASDTILRDAELRQK